MIIDKNLNLDIELEYAKDGSLAFASNIVTSADGMTIQNEPALVDFVNSIGIQYAGHISCNNEFVVFGKNNSIRRIDKNGTIKQVNTNWKWGGGKVFGTFAYNVNNELIIAVSERNLANGKKVPLKIINLERDYVKGYNKDDIYTLTPNIPKANMISLEYKQGNRIRKGKYNIFIKYFIDDKFETAWFPIGVPIYVYDNINSDVSKMIDRELIQAVGELNDKGIPSTGRQYNINLSDYYNEDDEYCDNNINIHLDIYDTLVYTHYQIGYIVNYNGGVEGRKTNKIDIKNKDIVIGDYSEPESVDDLTVNTFNIYNVNTMSSYKDRLYIANYKEENYNKLVPKIDTSNIVVSYEPDTAITRELKNQWMTKPGRAAVYNFYLHYVYPDGNFTDGIKFSSLKQYNVTVILGTYTGVSPTDPSGTVTKELSFTITHETYCQEIILTIQKAEETGFVNGQAVPNFQRNEELYNLCVANTYKFYYEIDPATQGGEVLEDGTVTLGYTFNINGDVLYKTPVDKSFNVDKLIFSGIKMYPEFVGYFISYEKPEYINVGEGFVAYYLSDLYEVTDNASSDTSSSDRVNSRGAREDDSSYPWKFYYPEFNIVGGKTNLTKLIGSGIHEGKISNLTGSRNNATGTNLKTNSFDVEDVNIEIKKTQIIAPDTYNDTTPNLGKEGYLEIAVKENDSEILASNVDNGIIQSYIGITNNKDIYLSKTKQLISLGYIQYQKYENNTNTYYYGKEDVLYNYDFYRCYSSIFFFHENGIIINTTESNPIDASDYNGFYINGEGAEEGSAAEAQLAHVGKISYWHETHYPLFLKEIHQEPQTVFHNYYVPYSVTRGVIKLEPNKDPVQKPNLILNPKYVNDLYKLDPVYYDYTGKLLINYDDSLYSNFIEDYKRTIRRSDVLQSESIKTAWRYFRPENYKVITEDKGDITNVVGIGHYFFAHCEHSLFMFDINNALKTQDKDVQLLQPDTFDVSYQEVFTSDKGYGGLQDFVSWICDDFGYIFYNKDGKKIHRFDNGKLLNISDGIDNLIEKYLPDNIYMGADRDKDRILFNFRGLGKNAMLSYSTLFNNWLSTHSYDTNTLFINLKDKLIIPYDSGASIQFKHYSDVAFNNYSLPVGNVFRSEISGESCIDVVFTDRIYNKIKVLDFITYIINKEPNDNFDLLQLEIYTNCCYSGKIDISQERRKVSEYNKPYYDYERWNFNWFRNRIDKIENGDVVDRLTGINKNYPEKVQRGYDNALITGKYVVVRMKFKNTSKEVNIKDIQAYFKN